MSDVMMDHHPTRGIREKIAQFSSEYSPYTTEKQIFQRGLSAILLDLPCTDNGNAIRFSSRFGHLIRYVAEQKAFFTWEGERWEEDKKEKVVALARETANFISIEMSLLVLPKGADEDEIRAYKKRLSEIFRWSLKSQDKHSIDAMVELVKSESGITVLQSELDQDDYLLNLKNGTFDLRAGKLKPHDPHDLITKLAPVVYDPETQCPNWNKFMFKVVRGNRALFDFLQDLVGCGLTGKQLDDILPISFGPGGNGKGIFAETLKNVLGDYASTATSDLFLARNNEGVSNDRACLVGVRFLTASETDEGRRLNEALVKSMTGGDTQKVRFLHKEFFELVPKFTAMLFTNHKPIIGGTDQGIWRRVKLIPWLHDFTKDPEIEPRPVVMARMEAESSGILNWAIAGYVRRMQTSQIQVPREVAAETDIYRRQSDTLAEFLEDCCVVDEQDAEVTKKDLYEKYCKFAEEAGQKNVSTAKSFGMRLMERTDIAYLGERKVKSARYWTGIRLRTDHDNEQTEVF